MKEIDQDFSIQNNEKIQRNRIKTTFDLKNNENNEKNHHRRAKT